MSLSKERVTSGPAYEHLIGRVKWFNNKAGYGFITVTSGELSGTDAFVHHSAINVENQQFKYLVQGEYVDFSLNRTNSSIAGREYQASLVSGINGGKLMCETRHDIRTTRNDYKNARQSPVQSEHIPKQRSVANNTEVSDNKDWTLVSNKRQPNRAQSNTQSRDKSSQPVDKTNQSRNKTSQPVDKTNQPRNKTSQSNDKPAKKAPTKSK